MNSNPFLLGLQKAAKESVLAINVGIHVSAPDNKIYNRSCWINGDGEIESYYDKLHLFDYGALKESNVVQGGTKIVAPVETVVGRVGLTICFDVSLVSILVHPSIIIFLGKESIFILQQQLRFPEISLALKRQDAQIITYPSAFTVPTGRAHWEVLLRSRAIETQAYVIAAAQVGSHNAKRTSYGHSMVVDPWGRVLLDLEAETPEPKIGIIDIDLDYREKIKSEMPLLRRT